MYGKCQGIQPHALVRSLVRKPLAETGCHNENNFFRADGEFFLEHGVSKRKVDW